MKFINDLYSGFFSENVVKILRPSAAPMTTGTWSQTTTEATPSSSSHVLSGRWFHQDFSCADPKSVKIQSSRQYNFALLGSACIKASFKMLMKSTPCRLIISFCIRTHSNNSWHSSSMGERQSVIWFFFCCLKLWF